jgi:hypothetical protein
MSETGTIERAGAEPTLPRLEAMAANLRRLTDLLLDGEYDASFVQPTRAAFERAWQLLVEAEEALPPGLPSASPAPVGDGGILIQWDLRSRSVSLAVPADPNDGYLYLRGPETCETVRELSGRALANALGWLLQP